MQRIAILWATILCITWPGFAQRVKTVSGSYFYMVPETQSYLEAKEQALQMAKIQILADTYGTVMDMSSATSITEEGSQIRAFSQSQVKGEWLETVGEPVFTRVLDGEQMAIKVEIRGKVRERIRASTEFIVKLLRGAPDIKFESDTFQSGDEMFLYFQAPADGYLAVYLFDGDNDVFCLLPYQQQGSGIFPVKGGNSYIFFSADCSDGVTPNDWVDEYTLNASTSMEMNRIYVIFSPHYFTKAIDNLVEAGLPRQIPFESFQKWLSRVCIEDQSASFKTIDITITSRL